jgi:hypothetical protein
LATLVVGVILFALAGNDLPPVRWLVVLLTVAVTLIGPVNRVLSDWLKVLRQPSPRGRDWTGLLLGALGTCYLIATGINQGRDLFPKTEDDCSYVIGTQMLARGHLWMPIHPLADFFESFYILVKPVYCSIYFPGTALMFTPMVWLHWGTWILPVVISGIIVGLLYRIVSELVDGVAGILAAIWLLSLTWFRTISIMVMSHLPMLFLGLLMAWAWMRWREKRKWPWALALGIVSGWAAITRPPDALAYALPIGIAMLFDLKREPLRRWALTGAMLLLGAAPFLSLQIAFDIGVTGHALQTPYTFYLHQDQPGAQYGIHRFDPTAHPASKLPQKTSYYEWCKAFFQRHQPGNFLAAWISDQRNVGPPHAPYLLMLVDSTLPGRLLLLLLPAGLLGLRDRRRLVLAMTVPALVLIYLFNPFFLEHYAIVIAPGVMICILWAARSLSPSPRVQVPLTALVLALCITSLWELKHLMPTPGQAYKDGMMESTVLTTMEAELPQAVQQPAVVLFRASPRSDFFEEPVYNTDVAWPDDAPIIRAHDLGDRDVEIIRYYAQKQPERNFYLFDRDTHVLTPLGNVVTLRNKLDHAGK